MNNIGIGQTLLQSCHSGTTSHGPRLMDTHFFVAMRKGTYGDKENSFFSPQVQPMFSLSCLLAELFSAALQHLISGARHAVYELPLGLASPITLPCILGQPPLWYLHFHSHHAYCCHASLPIETYHSLLHPWGRVLTHSQSRAGGMASGMGQITFLQE